jgi:leucine dehydrogenase
LVSDILHDPVRKLVTQFPGRVKEIDAKDVLNFDADIFAPCAMGGVLDEAAIRGLKYAIVIGAANNQLKATNREEEIRLAKILDERDILFQVDWMHNTGGVIAGMEEYMHREKASMENIMTHTEKVCKYGVRENLRAAINEGMTPTERAYQYYSPMIYGL